MNPFSISFAFEKSTKGTHKYAELGDPASHRVGGIYIKKAALPAVPPQQLVITVSLKEAAK